MSTQIKKTGDFPNDKNTRRLVDEKDRTMRVRPPLPELNDLAGDIIAILVKTKSWRAIAVLADKVQGSESCTLEELMEMGKLAPMLADILSEMEDFNG